MPICEVAVNPNAKMSLILPVSGAGNDVPVGTLLMQGATNNTNEGIAIPITASSNARAIGVLKELHDYSASGDALQATLVPWFQNGGLVSGNTQVPSHVVELLDNSVLIHVDYNLASTVAVASATTTVLTITSETAGQGGSFVYVNAGVGIGQLGFIQGSASGNMTLVSALTTTLTSTSVLTKILRHLYQTPIWRVHSATRPTTLDSVAGDGSGKACVLGSYIQRNNQEERMDPNKFHNMQGLSGLAVLNMFAMLQVTDSAFHPIS